VLFLIASEKFQSWIFWRLQTFSVRDTKIFLTIIIFETHLLTRVFWNRLDDYTFPDYFGRYIIWWSCLTKFFWHYSYWNYFCWISRTWFSMLFWNEMWKISREKFLEVTNIFCVTIKKIINVDLMRSHCIMKSFLKSDRWLHFSWLLRTLYHLIELFIEFLLTWIFWIISVWNISFKNKAVFGFLAKIFLTRETFLSDLKWPTIEKFQASLARPMIAFLI
jgi:hypothetical protein